MNYSTFKVYHTNEIYLGLAHMIDNRVRYKADRLAYDWFETRSDAWLRDFKREVTRLCRLVGHNGIHSIVTGGDSGVRVERV